jgi:hypothetical protein
MSESKTFVFGNDANNANNSLLASILPTLQNRGVDTGYLMGLMNNGNGGFFGNNGGFQDIIALIVIAAIFGNGNFGFGGWGNNNNGNSTEREMLMSAIQRNGLDLNQLAGSLNCSVGRVQDAVTAVSTQICNLAGQQGLSFQQVINSIQAGNSAIASQLASCCCDIRTAIADSNYLTERGFCNTNQILTRGFSDLGYAFRDQTCDLKQTANANTASILAKLDAIEDSRKDRELAEKDRMIATLTARSERQSELQPIYNALNEIQCNQPPVKKVACAERYVPVNEGINATYGLIPNYCGYGFPYAANFCNGFNNAF